MTYSQADKAIKGGGGSASHNKGTLEMAGLLSLQAVMLSVQSLLIPLQCRHSHLHTDDA